ncbi:MAG: SigB/SigF/SigG family RNA polymerase sigma factor [Solirubrobacterales bacterium]|nr:SigB/SigF/SigG family RNA polymerase sigma factor [Solirubrobacterales bacterium]
MEGSEPLKGQEEASLAPEIREASTPGLFASWRRDGDPSARAELIRRHMPLARRLAARYVRAGEQIDDLIQVASVGLINAVERFDPEHGAAFSSFAVPTILGELKRHFRDTGWIVRVDRRSQERATAVSAAERELSATGMQPTVSSLADHLDCPEQEVVDGLTAGMARNAVSLDAPRAAGNDQASDPDAPSLMETVGGPDPELEAVTDRAAIDSAVRHLPRMERRVLHLRFEEDLSQREIALRVGVSQMHVSRMLRRSLGELRELVDDKVRPAA